MKKIIIFFIGLSSNILLSAPNDFYKMNVPGKNGQMNPSQMPQHPMALQLGNSQSTTNEQNTNKQRKYVTKNPGLELDPYMKNPYEGLNNNVVDPLRLRDPFRRITVPVDAVEKEREVSPLEMYELSQYRVIGVIVGNTKPRAMIKFSGEQVYIVSENQHLGNRNGIIKKIRWDGVVVLEKYIDELGRIRKEEKLLPIEAVSKQ